MMGWMAPLQHLGAKMPVGQNRRQFITLVGGAAAWPLAARAQQSAMPVIGYLDSQSPGMFADIVLRGFRQGLKETGYVEGENVTIEYRWAENQIDRLPELAAGLVRRRVAVIVAGAPPAALAAKAATTTIPVVFGVGDDPVKIGLVASLARPGGNLTGINFLSGELAAKRLELLREMVPSATRVAALVDPTFTLTESVLREVVTAARTMGLRIQVLNASASREINAAFATLVPRGLTGNSRGPILQKLGVVSKLIQTRIRDRLRLINSAHSQGGPHENKLQIGTDTARWCRYWRRGHPRASCPG